MQRFAPDFICSIHHDVCMIYRRFIWFMIINHSGAVRSDKIVAASTFNRKLGLAYLGLPKANLAMFSLGKSIAAGSSKKTSQKDLKHKNLSTDSPPPPCKMVLNWSLSRLKMENSLREFGNFD